MPTTDSMGISILTLGHTRFPRSLTIGLGWLVCGLLLYCCLGVFFGTYRFDEIYFLHISWSAFKGYAYDYWGPGLWVALLKVFWVWVDGRVASAWMLRLALLVLVMVQAAFVFHLAGEIWPGRATTKRLFQALLTCVFLTVLCSYRGFELRPEILPNTLLLFGAFAMFRLADQEKPHRGNNLLIWTAGLGLVLSATVSSRHVLPAFAFFVCLWLQAWQRPDIQPVHLWGMLLLSAFVAGYLNLIAFNYFDVLKKASSYQDSRTVASWLRRLSIGGGREQIIARAGLLFLLPPILLAVFHRMGIRALAPRIVPFVAAVSALLGFYIFLFTVDVHPFEYVRSIEWILIVVALVALFRLLRDDVGKLVNIYRGMAALLVMVICIGAARDINHLRNTRTALNNLWGTASSQELAALSDPEVVRRMFSGSVIDQTRARGEYCARYPDGLAIVQDMSRHPIGMRDGGSAELGGWSLEPGKVTEIDFGRFQYIYLNPESIPMMDKWKEEYIVVGGVWIKGKAEQVLRRMKGWAETSLSWCGGTG